MTEIQGGTAEGWGRVADAFRDNFEHHRELGAACTVYAGGRVVADLWGGIADSRSGRPWKQDTVAVVWSTSKGAAAICAHMLIERGELDPDAPVARYWPEFAAAGKEDLKVRWLLSHQAGLPVVDTRLTFDDVCAWEPVIRALEAQKPLWTPGTQHMYHAKTYGFLVGEVVRRVTGKTLGDFFATEVASPLGLSSWIGLPEEHESRVARLEVDLTPPGQLETLERLGLDPDAANQALRVRADPTSVEARSATLGGAFPHNFTEMVNIYNTRAFRASEQPASNMVTDARSVARMYAATVGDVDDTRLLQRSTVNDMSVIQTNASTPHGGRPLDLAELDSPMSLGFNRPSRLAPLLGPSSFGHGGAGGSLGFADPQLGVGFGYVMNRMSTAMDNPRAATLISAIAASSKMIRR